MQTTSTKHPLKTGPVCLMSEWMDEMQSDSEGDGSVLKFTGKWLISSCCQSYLWLLVDLGVHVHTLRVEGDDVSFPDSHWALTIQPQTEVLLSNTDVHGGRWQAEALVDGALCGRRPGSSFIKLLTTGSQSPKHILLTYNICVQMTECSWDCEDVTRTHIKKLLQLFSAERYIFFAAELDSAEVQDVVDLLADDLQSLRVTHQIVHGPEGGRDGVPHRRPEDGKVMSWKSGGGYRTRDRMSHLTQTQARTTHQEHQESSGCPGQLSVC